MLFKDIHIKMIKEGTKTRTSRLWKTRRAKVGSIHLIKTKMLSKENFGRIRILNVEKRHLSDMDSEWAMKEGGYTKEEFLKLWFDINPKSEKNPNMFVIDFEYVGD